MTTLLVLTVSLSLCIKHRLVNVVKHSTSVHIDTTPRFPGLRSYILILAKRPRMWDVMLVWRKGNREKKLSLCYSIMYCYNGAQMYKQFLQVGQLYRVSVLLGLGLSSERLCVFSLHFAIGPWRGWLTIVPRCYDAVGWVMWPVKSSEMTYNVSSGTLNPTIPYQVYVPGKLWKLLQYHF